MGRVRLMIQIPGRVIVIVKYQVGLESRFKYQLGLELRFKYQVGLR